MIMFYSGLVIWYLVGYIVFINEIRYEHDVTPIWLFRSLFAAALGPFWLGVTLDRTGLLHHVVIRRKRD